MHKLNFPTYQFRIREDGPAFTIFDPIRKKYVALTPEEWVRQHVIRYLTQEKNVPEMLVKVESEFKLYNTRKRFDLAVFDRNGNALLLVECKAPAVPVTQDVVDQAVRYNLALKVGYLMLTNGLQHIFCQVDPQQGHTRIIPELPDYAGMV